VNSSRGIDFILGVFILSAHDTLVILGPYWSVKIFLAIVALLASS
jgi:hypothetical protein